MTGDTVEEVWREKGVWSESRGAFCLFSPFSWTQQSSTGTQSLSRVLAKSSRAGDMLVRFRSLMVDHGFDCKVG